LNFFDGKRHNQIDHVLIGNSDIHV